MAWLTVTLNDIRAEAANARIEAAVANDTHDLQGYFDKFAAGVIAEIRASIASCDRNQLDANTATVPPEWHGYACLRILSRLLARPGHGDESTYRLTEDQRKEIERRTADLERVAKCELAVTTPDSIASSPGVTARSAGTEFVGGQRRFTRDEMDGL